MGVAAGEINVCAIVITASNRTIRAWDPLISQPIGKLMEDRSIGVAHALTVIVLDGRPCVVAGTGSEWGYGALSVGDLTTFEQAGEPLIFPDSVGRWFPCPATQ